MKEIKIFEGTTTLKYEETDEKKQMLWDAFIEWCKKHNASTGDCIQNDDFNIDAPEFMADCIDNIIIFKHE